MDNEKIKQFIQKRKMAGDNDAAIAAFLKSKGVAVASDMFIQTTPAKPQIKTGLSGVAQVIGESAALRTQDYQKAQQSSNQLSNMNTQLIMAIQKGKRTGKDVSRLESQLKSNMANQFSTENIAPSVNKTNRQFAGDLMTTAGYLAAPISAGSVLGRVGIGTTMGALSGTGTALSEGKSSEDVLAAGLKGASVGAIISGTFEALGAGLRGISGSRYMKNRTANTYNKELEPNRQDLSSQIERSPVGQAFKTTGAEVRDAVDDQGKPLYTGTYTTLQDKAKRVISGKGDLLTNELKKYDAVPESVINRNEVAKNIIKEMQDRMGRLSSGELKTVKYEVSRMTEKTFNPSKAEEYKRLFDSKIPDNFWKDTGDRTKAIAVQARYILRDNLRTLINDKTNTEVIKSLNNAMGLAMDVRRLSATQLAIRATEKIGAAGQGSTSLWRGIYGKLIDDVFFNPAITTRSSQTLNRMGSKTGQTPLRATARNLFIQKSSK